MSVAEHLALLEAVELWDATDGIDADPCIESAWALLKAVERTKRNLGLAEVALHEFLCDVLPGGGYEFDDGTRVVAHVSVARTKWQHDDLTRDVVAVIADRQGYPVEPIRAVVDALLTCVSPSWKVGDAKKETGLRGLGLDPDEYCESRPQRRAGPPR